jgi:para-aminobenzoate synthetase / 4-amino-4-deoxychorismate lyase
VSALFPAPAAGEAFLRDAGTWLHFREPVATWSVDELGRVREVLAEAARRVETEGRWAVLALAYEAGPAFDPALAAHERPADGLPYLWIGLYPEPRRSMGLGHAPEPAPPVLRPSVTRDEFDRAFGRIQHHIAAGDTYQVNYTFRLRQEGPLEHDPWTLFRSLARAQEAPYAAYLDAGPWALASASPELFFRQDGSRLESRPMKGTARRGRTTAEDATRAEALAGSSKERAENLMVTDMIRNDLGRVAAPGSVAVPELFTVERYPTVLQMTSTITAAAADGVGPADVLAALFPCASITGAPKIATSRLIRDLETTPRGFYTGALGYLAPGRRAQLAVAIRTVALHRERGVFEYGVGGGIVADSSGESEYEECRLKARVLFERRPAFDLLETLLWRPDPPGGDFWLLDEHLTRLADAARYFDYPVDREEVLRTLEGAAVRGAEAAPGSCLKVRLTVPRRGPAAATAEPVEPPAATPEDAPVEPIPVALAALPVSSDDPFMFHKTTHRKVYRRAAASRPDLPPEGEVVLHNEAGELTETPRFNLVLELDGRWVTPPVSSGLLAGTFRARLLAEGRLEEAVLRHDDLARADRLWLVNSVRGFRRARLQDRSSEQSLEGYLRRVPD